MRWTKKQTELLKQHYPTANLEELEMILGKTELAIRGRANRLQLRRAGHIVRMKLKEIAYARGKR